MYVHLTLKIIEIDLGFGGGGGITDLKKGEDYKKCHISKYLWKITEDIKSKEVS